MSTPARELRDAIGKVAAVGKAVSEAAQQARQAGTSQAEADARTAQEVRDGGASADA